MKLDCLRVRVHAVPPYHVNLFGDLLCASHHCCAACVWADVREFLNAMSITISLGLQGIALTPLECIGAGGYVSQLLFWMAMPPCALVLVTGYVIVRDQVVRCSRAQQAEKPESQTVQEKSAPILLRILFLLYPFVSRVHTHEALHTDLTRGPRYDTLHQNVCSMHPLCESCYWIGR